MKPPLPRRNAESGTETPAAYPSESGTTTNAPVSDTFPDSTSQFNVQTASEKVNVTAGLPAHDGETGVQENVTYFMSNLPAELVPEETTPCETTPGQL